MLRWGWVLGHLGGIGERQWEGREGKLGVWKQQGSDGHQRRKGTAVLMGRETAGATSLNDARTKLQNVSGDAWWLPLNLKPNEDIKTLRYITIKLFLKEKLKSLKTNVKATSLSSPSWFLASVMKLGEHVLLEKTSVWLQICIQKALRHFQTHMHSFYMKELLMLEKWQLTPRNRNYFHVSLTHLQLKLLIRYWPSPSALWPADLPK